MSSSTLNDPGALGNGIGNVLLHLSQGWFIDQRPKCDAFVETVTRLKISDRLGQLGSKCLVDDVLNVDTVGADTRLPVVAKLGNQRTFDCSVQICIVEDDEGGITAEFETQFLNGGRALSIEFRSDFSGRAGND